MSQVTQGSVAKLHQNLEGHFSQLHSAPRQHQGQLARSGLGFCLASLHCWLCAVGPELELGRFLELGSASNPAPAPLDIIIHLVSKAEPITLLRLLTDVKVLGELMA